MDCLTPEWVKGQLVICDAAKTLAENRGDGPGVEMYIFLEAAAAGYPKALKEIQRLQEIVSAFRCGHRTSKTTRDFHTFGHCEKCGYDHYADVECGG